jgi:Flp pilus assembly pilin Flp
MGLSREEMGTWFRSVRACARDFYFSDAAQDLVEYALIAAMFALMCSVVLTPISQALGSGVSQIGKRFKDHTNHGLHKGWYK